ncbi:hypothetical protein N9023_03620 [Opitutaceae bacterium]|nr:hypothetical protein [Opitutaceae bacterium]MDB4474070.1 hypothetical protein [Opitutaceae bacterium]
MDTLVTVAVGVIAAYLLLGFVFAIPFVFRGAAKIDSPAAETGFFFKLILIPGSMVFWPMLLRRWIKGSPPPTERSAHRSAAKL